MTATAHMPGAIGHEFIPSVGFVVTMPDWLMSSARLKRLHLAVSKEALHNTLIKHWRTRIPGHFKETAKTKYGHKRRRDRYMAVKAAIFRSTTDLVKSSKTKVKMTTERPKTQIGGSADAVLTGRMFMRYPFPISRDQTDPRYVRIADMSREIASWTAEEMQQAAQQYRDEYVRLFLDRTAKSPRIRARITGALNAIRNA